MIEPILVYHLWPHDGWQRTHREFMEPVIASGLAEAAQRIVIGWAAPATWLNVMEVVGDLPSRKTTVKPLRHGMNEWPTLEMAHNIAKAVPAGTPMLYFHCRGTRYEDGDVQFWPVKDHNALMRYFLVERWREAVAELALGSSTVGVNLQDVPDRHYSGNMWWARSEAVAGLPAPEEVEGAIHMNDFFARRNACEFWINGVGKTAMKCLHTSGVHHYQQRYPRERYAG